MDARTEHFVRRVSRQELALNPYVWTSTYVMYAIFGVSVIVVGQIVPEYDVARVYAVGALLLVWSAVQWRMGAPAIGSRANHVVIAAVYLAVIVGTYAMQPGGAAGLACTMFIGPLAAVRLTDRRQIIIHHVLGTVAVLTPTMLGFVDRTTTLTALGIVPAMWVLGMACMVVLEAAERQGQELEELVRRDPLTEIGNRRMLDQHLAYEIPRHARTGRPFAIVTLDLNGFKLLNDTLGHAAGDALLVNAAERLQRVVRAQDTLTRQGGDEFCVLLPETSRERAERTVFAIRETLSGIDAGGRPLTTGIGVSEFPGDGTDAEQLLRAADERLLEDKLLMRMYARGVTATTSILPPS